MAEAADGEKVWIVSDPEICGGKPVIRGTRVPVEIIVALLKRGYKPEEIHEEYPSVPLEAIMEIAEKVLKRRPVLVYVKA